MIEALWSVEFVSNLSGFGSGVVVVENGKVLGGDAQYFYVGYCKVENGLLHANATITHYAGVPHSIFGQAKQFSLSVSGAPGHNGFELHGHVIENPAQKIGMRFIRRAELPS